MIKFCIIAFQILKIETMSIGSFFSGLFGKAKIVGADLVEQAEVGFDKAKDYAEEAIETAKVNAAPYMEKAEIFADEAVAKVSEFSESAGEALKNAVDSAKEHAAPLMEKAEVFASETIAKVEETFDSAKDKATDVVVDDTTDETPKA